jgi:hypothetical protein
MKTNSKDKGHSSDFKTQDSKLRADGKYPLMHQTKTKTIIYLWTHDSITVHCVM